MFFGHLRHWNSDNLAKALSERDILPVLSRQIVNMSCIAWGKHRSVQLSLALLLLEEPASWCCRHSCADKWPRQAVVHLEGR